MTANTAPTVQTINGRTPGEWEILALDYDRQARESRARAIESFERCDTDGFLSQAAADATAREYDARAAWAREFGYATMTVLLNTDGSIASTRLKDGQYGAFWVLNDVSTARYGKRFFRDSQANTYDRQRASNARRGFVLASARVPATAPKLRGSNMMSLRPWAEPEWSRVKAGEIEIIDADLLATLADRDAGRETV